MRLCFLSQLMASGERYMRLGEQSLPSHLLQAGLKPKPEFSITPAQAQARPLWVPPKHTASTAALEPTEPRLCTPDQTFKVGAALAGKERPAETQRPCFTLRLPSLLSLPSPPLPSLLKQKRSNTANYSFFFSKGRGRSCCQQLRGGRLRLLCRLSS